MNEKIRILKMVEEGKLTAEQAVELIDALEKNALEEMAANMQPTGAHPAAHAGDALYDEKMLRIIVDGAMGDKVNVQLPVKIIRQILRVTGKLPIKTEGMQDLDLEALTTAILECLDNEAIGNIVEVEGADGTTVKVFIG